jgi:cell division protease FtsH
LLMKYETIDSDQIDAVMNGREPGEPKDWSNKSDVPPSSPASTSDDKDASSGTTAEQTH